MAPLATLALLPLCFVPLVAGAAIPRHLLARSAAARDAAPTSGIASAHTGVGDSATLGLLVQFASPDGNITGQLTGAVPLIQQENGTVSWFGGSIQNTTDSFLVYDTFIDEAGRSAHLGGQVAASIVGQSTSFTDGLSIIPFDILAIKANDQTGASVTLGLRILFQAQDAHVADVQQFCRNSLSLVQAEQGTTNWICFQVPGTSTFGILDSFPDDDARTAHLNGQVAKGLFGIVPTLLTGPPDIQETDLTAATVKTQAPSAPVPVPSFTSSATLGLLVPISVQQSAAAGFQQFLTSATPLAAAEKGTLQWFAASFQNDTSSDFLVYDTFATSDDREAHLGGKVAGGLLSQMASISSVSIIPYDILAIKSTDLEGPTAGVTLGLQVLFNASSDDTVPQVQQFCKSSLALAQAEPGTLNWICFQIPQTRQFGILDSFPDDAARTAHLNGKIAKALFAAVPTLLEGPPDIRQTDIFAATAKTGPSDAAPSSPSDTSSGASDGSAVLPSDDSDDVGSASANITAPSVDAEGIGGVVSLRI